MKLHIRDFVIGDRETYCQMSHDFYNSGAVSHPIPENNFQITFALCIEKSPYVRGLMIVLDGVAAGFCLLSLTYSNESGGLVLWLEELYILPKYQGKGLGKALFSFLDEQYQGRVSRFRLEVAKENSRAIRLYEKLGFAKMEYLPMWKEY